MKYYTDKDGSKYYCLNEIMINYHYVYDNDHGYYFLYCLEDRSNNPLHRIDGPALEWHNGDKFWYFMGKFHNENGPAIEHSNGNQSWWYHGRLLHCKDKEEFLKIISMKAFL